MPVVEPYVCKHLQTACTILQGQVVIVVPFVVPPRLAGGHKTESLALSLQRLDAYDGIHLSVILGTGCGDYLYVLDVCRFQLFQFAGIAHFLIVNIDFWLPFCQHAEFPITTLLHHWHHRQQIAGSADIVQDGVLDIHRHTTLCHLVLRYLALHHHAAYGVGLGHESNGAYVPDMNLTGNGLISDIRHLRNNILQATWYHEVAVLIAHTAVDESSVVEQRYICKLHWISALVNNTSYHLRVCLLDALHKDTVFVASHLYRIETYYLLDGIFQREVVEMTGHSEIFQLVINKIYSFLTSDFIQVFKHFRQ